MEETKFYWVHPEADSAGISNSIEELDEVMESEDLVYEITEEYYHQLPDFYKENNQ
jgi:hypothetical protein